MPGLLGAVAIVLVFLLSGLKVLREYERAVIFRHAIRNGLIPVVTILGLQMGALMGGAVVTEQIFVVPGFGRLIVESVFTRDYPLVQGVVLITASAYVLINLLVDVSYSLLNPRIRIKGAVNAR